MEDVVLSFNMDGWFPFQYFTWTLQKNQNTKQNTELLVAICTSLILNGWHDLLVTATDIAVYPECQAEIRYY